MHTKFRSHLIRGSVLGVSLLMVAPMASALEEIIVSARKREENLQMVPVAVSVLTSEEIAKLNITNIDDVSKLSSSVIFDQGFASQDTRITIRGLAPTRGRQNVAVLVDGIDIASQAIQTNGGGLLLNPRLFDLERIEVVKGPQNALYGRTAFAGAVNYITRKPSRDFEARVGTDIGNNGQLEVRGGVSGPLLGETLLGGINVASWNHDGFYTNSVTGQDVGGTDGEGVSGTLVWNINDRMSATFHTEYTDDNIEQAPYSAITPIELKDIPLSARTDPDGAGPLVPAINPNLTQIAAVNSLPDGDDLAVTLSEDPRTGADYPGTDRKIWRNTIDFTMDFDGMKFTSLTHYATSDVFSFEDGRREGSVSDPAKTTGAEFWLRDETDLFSQELRLQSTTDGAVAWTVGALYWAEDKDVHDGSVNCISNAAPPFAPGLNCAPQLAAISSDALRYIDPWSQDTDHWSVYGLVEWEFMDSWKLIFEGRYSDEEVKVTGPDRRDPDGTGPLCALPRAVDGRGLTFPPCANFPASLSAAYGTLSDKVTDDFFSPKVTLQWQASADAMYYLSWAKATKPKGISIVGALTGFDPDASSFDDETLNVYEIGAKTGWLDNRLLVNSSLFYQEFDDKLVSSQKQDPDTGLLFAAPVNASKATVYGLELDIAWQATEALQLTASYTYLDTEYDDFTSLTKGPSTIADAGNCTIVEDPARLVAGSGVDDDFCQINLSGNELEYAPKHAFVGGYSWRQPLIGDTDWLFEGDVIYQDDRYQDAVNTVEFDSYTIVDFRLGIVNKQWDVIAYVDNAFEDDAIKSSFRNTYNQGITFFGGSFSPLGPPSTFVLPGNQTPIKPDQRQVGLRVNYRFGAP
ncbi:MAG: TonB-dependent receptor [Gammaproteobacteria bacterium]|nr:TonB-dependent receptor [Gammaproteobacteria bacterium]